MVSRSIGDIHPVATIRKTYLGSTVCLSSRSSAEAIVSRWSFRKLSESGNPSLNAVFCDGRGVNGLDAKNPEIKTANGLTDLQFGLVLVAASVGAVLGAQLSGRGIHRFGSKRVMSFRS